MPSVDLDSIVHGGSGGGDRKVVCETLFPPLPPPEKPAAVPDFPAESFCLPKKDEIEWFDRNAFYERKQSTKGNFNFSLTTSSNLVNSCSNRRSLKSKGPIFGLPKLPDSGQLCRTIRRSYRRGSARFVPKPTGKPAVPPETEPGSPKVSCIGRVRSKKEKSRRREVQKKLSPEDKAAVKTSGFGKTFLAIFRFCRRKRRRAAGAVQSDQKPPVESVAGEKIQEEVAEVPAAIEPDQGTAPGLGGLKRFSSSRRPLSWGGDDIDLGKDVHVAHPERSNPGKGRGPRKVAAPPAVECGRDWETMGPASV